MAEKKKPIKREPRIQYDYQVRLYDDGKYHWMYDLNMLKNPSVLIDVYKMLGMTIIITSILIFVIISWVYTVEFIMDEKGVEHQQAPRSQKVAKKISMLTVLVGLFARKPGVVGSGMLASRTSMITEFYLVKKVKAKRWMNTIMVNETFEKNRVYVSDADFDFVYDYISSHCPKAKIC